MPNRRITIKGPKNYDIPARLYTPTPCREPTHCAVLAHPYFYHNGSMDNPVVIKLACLLQSLGWVCLTFDFRGHRGAGAGRGASWRGHVERNDLQSCVDWLLHAHETLTHVCLAGYSYGALVASSCLPHPVPDRRVECSWLFISLPLDAYKYSLWMFPKPRRTCHVKYVDPPREATYTSKRKSFQATLSAAFHTSSHNHHQQQSPPPVPVDDDTHRDGQTTRLRKTQSSNDLALTRSRGSALSVITSPQARLQRQSDRKDLPRVLAIWGERDEFASRSKIARRRREGSGWEVEIFPEASHWIDELGDDVLDKMADRVTDWVDRGLG